MVLMVTLDTLLLLSLVGAALSMTASTATTHHRIIDSHLHVWATPQEAADAFPYAAGQEPPESLQDRASISALIQHMDQSGVDGALIVQPINHKFDHSYVTHAIKSHPSRLKGILLHDPALSPEKAVEVVEDLASKGFVGVRFNPYLWPKETDNGGSCAPMSSSAAALAVYRKCAELKMAVGVMCFQGLQLHFDDIVKLLHSSPSTNLILDHVGFCSLTDNGDEAFQQLLSFAVYPQVTVKISGLFRLEDEFPYSAVRKRRLEPLMAAFGADRLMFGTDFPFVLLQTESYNGTIGLISSWISTDEDRADVMGRTAERLFGEWGIKF